MSQTNLILNHLKEHGRITALQALQEPIGSFRLAARIKDLREDGHDIATVTAQADNGARHAVYHLIKLAGAAA